jgi:hypothetical protein
MQDFPSAVRAPTMVGVGLFDVKYPRAVRGGLFWVWLSGVSLQDFSAGLPAAKLVQFDPRT